MYGFHGELHCGAWLQPNPISIYGMHIRVSLTTRIHTHRFSLLLPFASRSTQPPLSFSLFTMSQRRHQLQQLRLSENAISPSSSTASFRTKGSSSPVPSNHPSDIISKVKRSLSSSGSGRSFPSMSLSFTSADR